MDKFAASVRWRVQPEELNGRYFVGPRPSICPHSHGRPVRRRQVGGGFESQVAIPLNNSIGTIKINRWRIGT